MLKALLTIATATALLTAGFLPWTTLIHYDPWSELYKYQSEMQLTVATICGVGFAMAIYLTLAGRRFVATTVIAFIFMSAVAVLAVLFRVGGEVLGSAAVVGILTLPLLAAVATKAANIASEKKDYISVGKKFNDSLNEAMRDENMAELFLWTIAWASGVTVVFLLSKAIAI